MFSLTAPAKLNLTLEVLGKRPDGYHEVATVMQAVTLCDRLTFFDSPTLEFRCDLPGWQAGSSLVTRAAALLASRQNGMGAVIHLEKRIPLAAGLGGDSSDAAAVLRGLNLLWNLGLGLDHLRELAGELGSDVPFFISAGTALAGGRGERITPLPAVEGEWFVILDPGLTRPARKTAALYQNLAESDFSDGRLTGALAEHIRRERTIEEASLINAFDRVAGTIFRGLDAVREDFTKCGAARVWLAGAGPCLFALFAGEALAIEVQAALKSSGYSSWLVQTCPAHDDNGW